MGTLPILLISRLIECNVLLGFIILKARDQLIKFSHFVSKRKNTYIIFQNTRSPIERVVSIEVWFSGVIVLSAYRLIVPQKPRDARVKIIIIISVKNDFAPSSRKSKSDTCCTAHTGTAAIMRATSDLRRSQQQCYAQRVSCTPYRYPVSIDWLAPTAAESNTRRLGCREQKNDTGSETRFHDPTPLFIRRYAQPESLITHAENGVASPLNTCSVWSLEIKQNPDALNKSIFNHVARTLRRFFGSSSAR